MEECDMYLPGMKAEEVGRGQRSVGPPHWVGSSVRGNSHTEEGTKYHPGYL